MWMGDDGDHDLWEIMRSIAMLGFKTSDKLYIHTDNRVCTMSKEALFRRVEKTTHIEKLYMFAFVLWKEDYDTNLLKAVLRKIQRLEKRK